MRGEEVEVEEKEKAEEGTEAEKVVLTKAEHEALLKKQQELAESHKSVQRELDKARRSGNATQHIQSRLDALTDQVGILLEALSSADIVPESAKQKVASSKASMSKSDALKAAEEWYGDKIAKVLEKAKIAWGDAPTTKLQELWNAGKFEAALDEAIELKKADPDPKEKQEEVDRKVQEVLKGVRKVDTGEPSGGSSVVTLEKFQKMSVEERLKNLPKLKEWLQSHS